MIIRLDLEANGLQDACQRKVALFAVQNILQSVARSQCQLNEPVEFQ